MKKTLALLLALVMALSLAACGGSGAPAAKEASHMDVSISSEPETIDPALNSAVSGSTLLVHLFSGLAKWEQDAYGVLKIVPDAAEELPDGVENADGTVTYTYTLRQGMKWSDGEPVTAQDFVFAWQRAANPGFGADYGYMFQIIKGYSDRNSNARLAVEAKDERTIRVTLNNAVPYWNELLAFPVYFPVREDVVSDPSWAADPATYVCNGPYTMTEWDHGQRITLEKNPNYFNAAAIKMDRIDFHLTSDSGEMLTNFENGSWLLIDDVPVSQIPALKESYPNEFVVVGQIGTYYCCWNVNEEILPAGCGLTDTAAERAREEIRQAVGLLIDRNYIVEQIAQGGQVPASSFVAMGMTNPDGSQFYKTAGAAVGYDGYFDTSPEAMEENVQTAMATLKKYYRFDSASGKFTDFPALRYLYDNSQRNTAIAEYIRSTLSDVGIEVVLDAREFAETQRARKDGDYSISRTGWLADYNDPICFLDMWTTHSGNNFVQYGRDGHRNVDGYDLDLTRYGYDIRVENGTWAQTYDVLISTIKSCGDEPVRYQLMHEAEDLLMSTGCICPLFFYTDIYMLKDSVSGFFSNPLGYKYFMYCTVADAG